MKKILIALITFAAFAAPRSYPLNPPLPQPPLAATPENATVVSLELQKALCAEQSTMDEDLDDLIMRVENSCLTIYYELLLRRDNFFTEDYNNQLILSFDLDEDFPTNGTILLRLINYLQTKSLLGGESTHDATYLLGKINRLFYLLFHRAISRIEAPKEAQAGLIRALHILYRHALPTTSGSYYTHPFRSLLSKLIISLLVLDYSYLRYEARKERIFFEVEKFRKQFHAINQALGTHGAPAALGEELMNSLEAYYIIDPLLGTPRDIKKRAAMALFTIGSLSLIGYLLWQYREPLLQGAQHVVSRITAAFSKTVREEFAKPVVEEMNNQIILGRKADQDGNIVETGGGIKGMVRQVLEGDEGAEAQADGAQAPRQARNRGLNNRIDTLLGEVKTVISEVGSLRKKVDEVLEPEALQARSTALARGVRGEVEQVLSKVPLIGHRWKGQGEEAAAHPAPVAEPPAEQDPAAAPPDAAAEGGAGAQQQVDQEASGGWGQWLLGW